MVADCYQEEVAGYQPKPDDLDYPARLERLAAAALSESPPTSAADLVEGDTSDANVRCSIHTTQGSLVRA